MLTLGICCQLHITHSKTITCRRTFGSDVRRFPIASINHTLCLHYKQWPAFDTVLSRAVYPCQYLLGSLSSLIFVCYIGLGTGGGSTIIESEGGPDFSSFGNWNLSRYWCISTTLAPKVATCKQMHLTGQTPLKLLLWTPYHRQNYQGQV